MNLVVSTDDIAKHYTVLSLIGNLGLSPADGFLRAAYSDEETAVMRHFEVAARKLGLRIHWDEVGNLVIEAPGCSDQYVETGSHVDTVPMGGNYDGAAGVVAGFEALKQILPHIGSCKRGVRLRIWRGEESATFGSVFTGSSAAFGKLDAKVLSRRYRGQSLEEAMISQGVDLSFIREKKATIPQLEIDKIAAHIELHIEQGNFLEVGQKDIGVVTSIRGPRRARILLRGEFDHSGATPMGREYRKDVNLALAHILVRLDKLANERMEQGADLVQTIGVINSEQTFNSAHEEVYQNAVTKVSGYGYFTLDIRSVDNAFRQRYCDAVDRIISDTAREFGVTATIETIGASPAVEKLNAHIQEASVAACEDLGCSYQTMPSGATHDCVVVSQQTRADGTGVPIGMLLIPCRGGKSHSPDEFASDEAIAKGATVLARALYQLASE